jgi:parvulin-like peptidyl-prolyl isomerase
LLAAGLSGQTKPAASAAKPAAPAKAKPAAPAKAKPAAIEGQPADPNAKPGELSDSTVVLTIAGQTITKGEFERFLANLPPQIQQRLANQPKRPIAEQYAGLKVLAAEARKRKLQDKESVKQQMQIQTDNILVEALARDVETSVQPSDADLQAYFEEHRKEFEQVKARHILIRFQGSPVPVRPGAKDLTKEESLAKAKEIRAQLAAGAKFDELARKESDDTGSGAQGGDLGTFGAGSMVPPFEKAVFALKQGEISEPVETQFGYHIIEAQELVGRDLASVKDQVAGRIKPEATQKAMEAIRTAADVKYNDAYFPIVAPPAPPPQPQAPPQ